jgi:hypothetical protein
LRTLGTTSNIFHDFFDYVCCGIETNNIPGTDFHRLFIWDNLAAHLSAYVHNTVTGCVGGPSNFSIVPRPPYYLKHGPIEYQICEVTEKIQLKKEDNGDMNQLEHEIKMAAHQVKGFDETIIHCEYIWNYLVTFTHN